MSAHATPRPWALIAPVLVLTAGAQLEVWAAPLPGSRPLLAAVAAIYSLALLFGGRSALPAVAVSYGAIAVMAVAAPEATNEATAPLFAGLAGAFVIARFGTRAQARIGLALGLALLVLVARAQPTLATGLVTYVISAALVAVSWGVGYSLRARGRDVAAAHRRALAAEAERDTAARLAVAEERTRIARELHDIVAHSVSVMVLQVGVVRHGLPATRPDHKEALQNVERVGREALSEMRLLLGAMRADDDADGRAPQPQPRLAGVATLVEDTRRSGLEAVLVIEGDARTLPPGLELSAYRIVQEGLTNALKHGGARHVQVRLRYDADALTVEVHDDGNAAADAGDGAGHGLIGIRERVNVYGGRMTAGRAPNGGFLLHSRLPIEPTRP